MIRHETQVRVRYADTDQMGYVYYGNYARYFEIGRTELVRDLGVPYSELEADGVMMPVLDMHVHYRKAGRYDELLTVETRLAELPSLRIRFDHRVLNPSGEVCVEGHTTLVFVRAADMRPVRPPVRLLQAMQPHFAPA